MMNEEQLIDALTRNSLELAVLLCVNVLAYLIAAGAVIHVVWKSMKGRR